ncbi:methyl-accepting chemotaxis protein [Acetobacterium tundrae]|uniref:HAMP domain-containing protein n=1 Tax=Acetobacterium tundrae TaxID=132932 RepID=A0ABR6WIR2_9FIRM|nr:methyl-accepting chemotaxis protein [Acetobacterium tundrae]MBC3796151.1 HAMP domain-containing protein [Acetobacterium tundrae]
MEKRKNLLSKMILSIGLPIAILFAVMVGILFFAENQFDDIQSLILLTGGIGLVIMIGIIIFAMTNISNKISKLAEAADRLATGDIDVDVNIQNSNDQLGDLGLAITTVAENIKTISIAAKKMADGDLSVEILPNSEKDLLGKSLLTISNSVKQLETETATTAGLAKIGNFDKRVNVKELSGDYKTLIENVNTTMDAITGKMELYLAIVDALPYRVTTMDKDRKIIFVNKTLEDLMKLTGAAENRESIYGVDCNTCNLDMCNTEDCGIRRLLEKGLTEYPFEFMNRFYRMDTVDMKDKNGDSIGFVEISHDTTPTMSVNVYTEREVKRLASNLLNMADGDFDFDMNIAEVGEYTVEINNEFKTIELSLGLVKKSIGTLIENATQLTTAAIEGKLEIRADETKFKGSWKELIGGMNDILEEVSKPLKEVSEVFPLLLVGNLKATVNGSYQGEFEKLKQSVNNVGKVLDFVISDISNVTGQMADGNLNVENIREYDGDFNAISIAINEIIKSLNLLLGNIDDAAQQVTAGSNQVSDASQSLAQGSTEQASSVQELSASIAEIADQTKNNAVNANRAKELTTDVQEYAAKGNAQMSEMQNSMAEINKSSSDISKIIKVIDDIAFQTNILALNAAVEAARAGQHGKGFAVVAEEVRTLAARSAEAAKETSGLIEGSIDKVEAGTKIADETAAALDKIVEGIVKVTDLVGKIAEDSNEQASGIAQVNMGIEQVAQVVQNNSATAEQSAAASEELSSQAQILKEMIGQFQLRK